MKIKLSPEAYEDLKAIHEYISKNASPARARKVTKRILDSIDQLKSFPYLGKTARFEADENFLREDITLRELVQPPFRIFYRVDTDAIRVITIIDARRKPPTRNDIGS